MNTGFRVALVTGARRGIGRATAEVLAGAGLAVAVTSRDVAGAEEVAKQLTGLGAPDALAVALDLGDRSSIEAALDAVIDRFGTVDVLVNNALCAQPGSQEPLAALDFEAFEAMVVGEVVNTTYLTTRVLAVTGDRPLTLVNVGSAAAEHTPARPVGQGGWAFSYSATKSALHRLAPFVALEYGERVRAFTVDPGLVRTEALLEHLGDIDGAAPPSLPARVITWLATDPGGDAYAGRYLHAQPLAVELGWKE